MPNPWHSYATDRDGNPVEINKAKTGDVRFSNDSMTDTDSIDHYEKGRAGGIPENQATSVAVLAGFDPDEYMAVRGHKPAGGSEHGPGNKPASDHPTLRVLRPNYTPPRTTEQQASDLRRKQIRGLSDEDFDRLWQAHQDANEALEPRRFPTLPELAKKKLGSRSVADLTDEEFNKYWDDLTGTVSR